MKTPKQSHMQLAPACASLYRQAISACALVVCMLTCGQTVLQAQCVSCVSSVNFSLSSSCSDEVLPIQVLTDSSNCPGNVVLELFLPDGTPIGNTVNGSHIGMTLEYMITNTDDNSACSGNLNVLDERGPTLVCAPDTSIGCTIDIDELFGTTATDCQDFDITYEDQILQQNPCEDTTLTTLRRYIATDESGNTDTCFQTIYTLRASLDELSFPPNLEMDLAIDCSMPLDTSPATTGWPMIDGMTPLDESTCGFNAVYTDAVGQLCGNTIKILRRWRITDECSTVFFDSTQVIEVRDTSAPSSNLIDTLRVNAGVSSCSGFVTLPSSIVSDACDTEFDFQVTGPFAPIFSNGGFVGEVESGMYDVVYRITDGCNNTVFDTLKLIIEDNSAPTASCSPETIVPLQSNGKAWLPAHAFDAGSFDNCNDVFFKVRRTSPNADCEVDNPDNRFADRVAFCCDDAAEESITVILRVYDVDPGRGLISPSALAGRYSDCTIDVLVQDKIAPGIVCPSDLTVSCTFDYNPQSLSIFGSLVQETADRDSICLNDPDNPIQSCLGIDGTILDNCGATVSESSSIDIGMCQTGTIERTFTAEDAVGNVSSCVQTIEIQNFDPFFINSRDSEDPDDDVIWPRDYFTDQLCDLDDVAPELLPDSSAYPVFLNDDCDQLGYNHSDEVFDVSLNGEACAKILRTWRVMDWCQFDGSEFEAWTYQQTIVITNNVAPRITSDISERSMCTTDDACGPGFMDLVISASDDCTADRDLDIRYTVDLDGDDFFDYSGVGADASGMFPIGDHVIIWIVEDGCGNEVRVPQNFSIINCKKPTPYCTPDLVTTLMPVDVDNDGNPENGMARLWASDFDHGSHHICGYEVTASFSADVHDTVREFDCSDIGTQEITIWITDENGQQDFCVTQVTIQNSQNIPDCDGLSDDDDPMGIVSGRVRDAAGNDFAKVDISLMGSGLSAKRTDSLGSFVFADMPFGGSYTVEPHYEGDAANGVSTFDIVKIQKHLLATERFSDPQQYLAADVNRSGDITALDIIQLRRLLLGDIDEFSEGSSWTFLDANEAFDQPEDILDYSFAQEYDIPRFVTDMVGVDFLAVKAGDIDNSHDLPGLLSTEDRTDKLLSLETRSVTLVKGAVASVPLYLGESPNVEGYQLALSYDPTTIDVLGLSSGNERFDASHYRIDTEKGLIRISWSHEDQMWNAQEALLTLKLKAKSTVDLSEVLDLEQNVLKAELYDDKDVIYGLKIKYLQDDVRSLVSSKFVPNPFSDDTDLNFYLNKKLNVNVEIYAAGGKRVFQQRIEGQVGNNVLNIPGDYFASSGVYHCKISTRNEILTSKLMYVKK